MCILVEAKSNQSLKWLNYYNKVHTQYCNTSTKKRDNSLFLKYYLTKFKKSAFMYLEQPPFWNNSIDQSHLQNVPLYFVCQLVKQVSDCFTKAFGCTGTRKETKNQQMFKGPPFWNVLIIYVRPSFNYANLR